MNFELTRPTSKTLKSKMAIPVGADILELGCRDGQTMWELDSKMDEAATLTAVGEKPVSLPDRAEFVQSKDGELPSLTRQFDFIYFHDLLGRVANPEKTIQEAAIILRPGGKLFMAEPDLQSISLGAYAPEKTERMKSLLLQEERNFPIDVLKQMAAQADLEPVGVEAWVQLIDPVGPENPLLETLGEQAGKEAEAWRQGAQRLAAEGGLIMSVSNFALTARKQT